MASKRPQARTAGASIDDAETNVQVILRCRPLSPAEVAQRTPQVIKCDEAIREVTLNQSVGGKQFGRTYHFDKVFTPETTQERLYDSAISPIVDEVLQGFNCTIFAYGQTGTGKTHTMTGDINAAAGLSDGAGVIPRAVAQIFTYLEGIGGGSEYTVKCCFLELYNEEITDLLAMGNEPPKVRILEDRSGVVLQGLEEPHVKSAGDIFSLLDTGSARRRTAETLLNKQSSRSHSVFVVTVSVREVLAEGEEVIRIGKLYLVDLAGSENVSRSGAVDQRAKEAGNINKSLLTLGRVITALVEGQGHVPYRDSKLTRLLRDSLGGRTKTCIIATIAPTVQCQEETLSTLDYAHRAKNIKNKPEVNQKISKTTHLKEMGVEIARLKAELMATRERNGVFLPPAQYEEECAERQRLTARVEELEEECTGAATRASEEKAALLVEWEGRVAEVRGELDAAQAELDSTRSELEATKIKVAEREYVLEAHRGAEKALAAHAGGLNDGLAAAAADVARLFKRVDAKNALEEANLEVAKELRDGAVARLAALETAVAAAAGAQGERFARSRCVLSEAARRKAAASEEAVEKLGMLQQAIDGLAGAAEAAAGALAEKGCAAVGELGRQQAEFLELAQAASAEASAALEEAHSSLTGSAQEEKAALEELLAGQAAATAAVSGASASIVAAVRQSLEEAQAQAQAVHTAAGECLEGAQQAAEAASAEFSTSVRQEQQALLGQLSALISGFVDRAEGQVKASATAVQQQLGSGRLQLQASVAQLAAGAGTALEGLHANEAAVQAAQAAAAAALEQQGAKVAAVMEMSASHAADLEAAARDHAAAAASALAKHSKGMAAAAKKEAKALVATAEKEGKKFAVAATAAGETRAEALASAEAHLEADGAALEALEGDAAEGVQALNAFTAAQREGLAGASALVTTAVDERYAVDGDRHDVPATRQHAVPPRAQISALRAPAEDALLAQFRSANGLEELGTAGADLGVDKAMEEEQQQFEVAQNECSREEENECPVAEAAAPVAAAEAPRSRRRRRTGSAESVEEEAAAANTLSPSLVGQKRARASDDGVQASPSKLRAAFQRRRATRHTTAE